MRDILTIIASIVILILAVALAAPPFVDWEAHRDTVDRIISRASGTEARTEGRIGIRLLPSPKIRVDRLVRRAVAMEGTCTGEHGVGQKKIKYLQIEHGTPALDLMRVLKQAIDPHNIMNPGKIFTL